MSAPQSRRRDLPVKLGEPPSAATDGHLGAQIQRALEAAYRYLSKRERTTTEVARHLKREAFSAEAIAQAIAVLHDEGSLDDHRFARLFTEDKRDLEQWGSERIRSALARRGVDVQTVTAVLAVDGGQAGNAPESERERALALLRHRFPDPPRSRRDRDRALGVLLRKGYEPDLAVETLSAYARD